ncbi:FTR1 family iron permease [Conservatibacter flavescens]|uniref:Iron permease n=1 Tax=Conservatibacter flavescens TaxID=28161 RepID=A0A2M8S5P6_9PAST|nr:FTR1 family protein [Conservatibacter flavescens]PJG86460.1 iron permease [Conservatibacter flavescens]
MRIFFSIISLWFVLCFSPITWAKVSMNHLFVELSDAMSQVKQQNVEQAKPHLLTLQAQFEALPTYQSEQGKQVSKALEQALLTPNQLHLDQLSKALYAFEKEQNPIDYVAKRQQFTKRIMPVYEKLHQAIQTQQLTAAQTEYKRFNTTWTVNEKVVRDTSLGHYGQIETAMTLLRIAMFSEPADFAEMSKQSINLGNALESFQQGKTLQPQSAQHPNAPETLPAGIELLEKSYQHLLNRQNTQAKEDITLFIQQWPIFEGEVRTRDSNLYTQIESNLPLILLKGDDPDNLVQFRNLIDDLYRLDIMGSYSALDAMLVLLREGTEALLIIIALLTALNAANQPKAKRWIYGGAGLGILASIGSAVALQQLFPAVSAGKNREILEGAVGIFAVIMMLLVGGWLHSKSSIKGWKKFMDKHITQAIATGSLISMFSLSFLSVFREGAETILFYAGMLPLISLNDLLLGIGLALVLLCLIAFCMAKSSHHLPIPTLFKLMTLLIYLLGFKILGVSIHALQLTQTLEIHSVTAIPNIPVIGFYANVESIVAQLIYLLSIPLVGKLFKR